MEKKGERGGKNDNFGVFRYLGEGMEAGAELQSG